MSRYRVSLQHVVCDRREFSRCLAVVCRYNTLYVIAESLVDVSLSCVVTTRYM